ncbi:MAG: T9SS type A sorting domain-containing protein [Bacteroidota bacterium]
MKRTLFVWMLVQLTLSAQVKIWKQSSADDFSSGTFDRVTVTMTGDGALTLIHPVVKVVRDTFEYNLPRFVSYDDAGNYLQGWISAKKVFVQKFNSAGQTVSGIITVDENNRADGSMVGVALMNNGQFAVGWTEYLDSSNGFVYSFRYCQFFDASNAKIGMNKRFFGTSNATHSIPYPIADRINGRYFIVGTEGNSTKGFQSYGWLVNSSGMKLRDSLKIVPFSKTKNEYHISGKYHKGKFALIWDGSDDNTMPDDTYFVLADSNGSLLTTPVTANGTSPQGTSPAVAFDTSGNCIVTWTWSAYILPGPPDVVYGQAFDAAGRKIGGVVKITDFQSGYIYWQDISFVNGMFRFIYGQGFSNGQPELQWSSYWKISPVTTGTYLSRIFDVGSQQTNYQQLAWNGLYPGGTRIKYQLRSVVTGGGMNSAEWMGPTSGADYYTNSSGMQINSVMNGKRYIQLKAILEADTNGTSPVLNDITLSYAGNDSIAPAAVTDVSVTGEHRRIMLSWTKSSSADVRSYRIDRSVSGKDGVPGSFVLLPAQSTSFVDSSVSYDTLYQYGITAVDSTFNESPFVKSSFISPRTMKVFVTQSGSPSGDGSAVKPFSLITQAIAYSLRGDTVFILPGEYRETITLKRGVALIGSGAALTRVISENSGGGIITASDNLIRGFTIQAAQGVYIQGNNITISENIFIHQGSGFDAAVSQRTNSGIIVEKNFFLNFSFGVFISTGSIPGSVQTVIRNNIFRCATGVQNNRSNIACENNTFVMDGAGTAVMTSGIAAVRNNCFVGYPSVSGYIRSVSRQFNSSLLFEYNDRWNCNGDAVDSAASSNIAADPLFVNVAKNNFRLMAGSPCSNAGYPSSEFNDVDGSRNDIGAYGGPDPLPEHLTLRLATGISLRSVSGFPGDTVSVDILLSSAAGIKKGEVGIRFNEEHLSFIDASATALTNGASVSWSATAKGSSVVRIVNTSEIASGSGALLTMRFRLSPNITQEIHSNIEFDHVICTDGDDHLIALSSLASGTVVIKHSTAFPHRIFVDGSAGANSDGSLAHPYGTIQQGVNSANENDTVFVAAGTYTGPVIMKSNVTVLGSGVSVTTIVCPDDPMISIPTAVRFKNVQRSSISGFTLKNLASIGTVIEVTSSEATIEMNRIDQSGMAMYSVMVSAGSLVHISGNYFIESKYGASSLLTIASDDAVISHNTFFPSSAPEMIVLNGAARTVITNNRFLFSSDGVTGITGMQSRHSTIANNLFTGQGTAGAGVHLLTADSTDILNNIFDIRKNGISDNGGSHRILNNIFLENAVAVNVSQSAMHRYNLFWKNTAVVYNGSIDPTELTLDPLFQEREQENYRPSVSSPLRNGGDPSPQWNDKDGTRNDIGIFGGPYADSSLFVTANICLRIGNGSGAAGDTVRIPVIASGILGMSGLRMMIELDGKKLQFLNVRTAPSTRSFTILQTNIGQSMVSVEMNGSGNVMIDSAAILELSVIVEPQATGAAFVKFQNAQIVSGSAQLLSVRNIFDGLISLTPLSAGETADPLPKSYALSQNYPNPFNPVTRIQYRIPTEGRVVIKVFDLLGREVRTLIDDDKIAGTYEVDFDARNCSSGMYLYTIRSGEFSASRKMILLK